MNLRNLAVRSVLSAIVIATFGIFTGTAAAGTITYINQTNSGFGGTFRTGTLTFTWDTTTNKFLSGTFVRSPGDFMSGTYTLNATTQLWQQNPTFPDRQVLLYSDAAHTQSLSTALTSISTFAVNDTLTYYASIVSPSIGVNEVWGTPGVVKVSGVTGVNAVPEPASMALIGIGVAGMAGYGWRRRKQAAV